MNEKNREMKPSIQKELEKLITYIEDSHIGDYTAVSRDLYRTINYLHYVEPGAVGVVQLRDACFTLYSLAESFFEAHRLKEKQCDQKVEALEESITADDLWVHSL